jgi:hypothetical protein
MILRILFTVLGTASMLLGFWLALFPRIAQRKLIFSVPEEEWDKPEFFFAPFRKALTEPDAFVFYAVAIGMALIFVGLMLFGLAWYST